MGQGLISGARADGVTLESVGGALRIKDNGVKVNKIDAGAMDASTLEISGGKAQVKDGGVLVNKPGAGSADGASIEVSGGKYQVKALGITAAMLAGSIPAAKLNFTPGDILYADKRIHQEITLFAFPANVSSSKTVTVTCNFQAKNFRLSCIQYNSAAHRLYINEGFYDLTTYSSNSGSVDGSNVTNSFTASTYLYFEMLPAQNTNINNVRITIGNITATTFDITMVAYKGGSPYSPTTNVDIKIMVEAFR
jgi:hypothetical protein